MDHKHVYIFECNFEARKLNQKPLNFLCQGSFLLNVKPSIKIFEFLISFNLSSIIFFILPTTNIGIELFINFPWPESIISGSLLSLKLLLFLLNNMGQPRYSDLQQAPA